MGFFSTIVLIALGSITHGEQANVNLLEQLETHRTTEKVVAIGGETYRQIEWQGKSYYVRLIADPKVGSEMDLICQKDITAVNKPALIYAEKKLTQRTAVFLQFLQGKCVEADSRGNKRFAIAPDMGIGVSIASKKTGVPPTKVWVNPLAGGGVFVEF